MWKILYRDLSSLILSKKIRHTLLLSCGEDYINGIVQTLILKITIEVTTSLKK